MTTTKIQPRAVEKIGNRCKQKCIQEGPKKATLHCTSISIGDAPSGAENVTETGILFFALSLRFRGGGAERRPHVQKFGVHIWFVAPAIAFEAKIEHLGRARRSVSSWPETRV